MNRQEYDRIRAQAYNHGKFEVKKPCCGESVQFIYDEDGEQWDSAGGDIDMLSLDEDEIFQAHIECPDCDENFMVEDCRVFEPNAYRIDGLK